MSKTKIFDVNTKLFNKISKKAYGNANLDGLLGQLDRSIDDRRGNVNGFGGNSLNQTSLLRILGSIRASLFSYFCNKFEITTLKLD